jgi:hypothetical protein
MTRLLPPIAALAVVAILSAQPLECRLGWLVAWNPELG